jgi:hypothetical protein
VITRIKMSTAGAFEVWVNGTKSLSLNGDFRAMGPSLRWSSGIYCTRWDTEMPAGQSMLSIFHDSLRIATTLAEADPATWGGGTDPTPPADAGTVAPDAGVPTPDATTEAGSADAMAAAPDTGGQRHRRHRRHRHRRQKRNGGITGHRGQRRQRARPRPHAHATQIGVRGMQLRRRGWRLGRGRAGPGSPAPAQAFACGALLVYFHHDS